MPVGIVLDLDWLTAVVWRQKRSRKGSSINWMCNDSRFIAGTRSSFREMIKTEPVVCTPCKTCGTRHVGSRAKSRVIVRDDNQYRKRNQDKNAIALKSKVLVQLENTSTAY